MTVTELRQNFDLGLFAHEDTIEDAYNNLMTELEGNAGAIISLHILMRTIAVHLENDKMVFADK